MAKYFIWLFLLSIVSVSAQTTRLEKGSKVFVKNTSKNENAIKTADEAALRLKEWAYWNVVNNKSEADFTLQVETTVSKGITATSWGGKSYTLVAKIMDKKDEVVWESNAYKSSPNGTNGFNSSRAVVKKLMRDLKKKFKD